MPSHHTHFFILSCCHILRTTTGNGHQIQKHYRQMIVRGINAGLQYTPGSLLRPAGKKINARASNGEYTVHDEVREFVFPEFRDVLCLSPTED